VELDRVIRRLIDLLTPTVSCVGKGGPEAVPADLHLDTHHLQAVHRLWGLLEPIIASHHSLSESLEAWAAAPEDEDRRRALQSVARDALAGNGPVVREMELLCPEADRSLVWRKEKGSLSPARTPGLADKALQRLEMLELLRSGIDPIRIAAMFKVPLSEVFRINYDYSTAGVQGAIVPPEPLPTWIEQLDKADPLLRRLEMVRLLRTGTPAGVVARQFDALEDYVLLVGQRFAEQGVAGIITDDDRMRFAGVRGSEIRICSYNLQGVRKEEGAFRFRRIARELSAYRPDLIAFQEAVRGGGVEDTSGQVARWLSSILGEHYRSDFTYCHQFMDRYPEGVAVCARVPMKALGSIDLTTGLSGGLRPSMNRFAHVTEATVSGKNVILASVHLDHTKTEEVRTAQVEKLLWEMKELTPYSGCHALVIAGDLNAAEDSPAVKLLNKAGFRDSYRACHKKGGATFPVPNPTTRIDYILVKGQAEIVSAEVILDNQDFSDHLGILTVLT
jgi:endonuclease/exonuclease/phosphatase family metal-dependent hydrolase